MFHEIASDEVIKSLISSGTEGLSAKEAEAGIIKYGKNHLAAAKKVTLLRRFLEQISELMVIILIVAGIISFALGESVDAIIILFIVLLNAVIGVLQEYKAEKSVEALRKMMSPNATVIRDGEQKIILAEDLVPGDIIILEEGSKVPADARIIDSAMLKVDEAVLTGESVPREKADAILSLDVALADRTNMLFMGTTISQGRCKAIVVDTGMKTEFGKIAGMTANIANEKSPLQKELALVGKFIAKIALVICALVFVVGLMEGRALFEMFLFAVSLGVAAVPEGLPATLTILLALGVQRMAKRRAIIKKLSSVETLGGTSVICTDKTGTLTKNEMTVKKIFINSKVIDVEGDGYEPKGRFLFNGSEYYDVSLNNLLMTGLLCNNSFLKEEEGRWKIIGDPTEGALLVSAEKAGLSYNKEWEANARIYEIPFSSDRRIMITVNKEGISGNERDDSKGSGFIAYMKGAPDAIISKCSYIEIDGKVRKITAKDKEVMIESCALLSNEALRVLGFAYKKIEKEESRSCKNLKESGFILQGLQGMIDPPRSEVKDAVDKCKAAGIKIFVITGDNGLTAKAIAKQIGIADEKTKIITGVELDSINDEQLALILKEEQIIFARVTAEHKMRVVSAVKKQGLIVAVTGDGVNDAPALKKADIGVAMGITGTDVSKEASEMILTDDSFATIVNAIEEGRSIYSNITKFIRYMFSSNLGEVIAILLGLILFPEALILTAVQLLWINLGTDVLPALALGLEPVEKGIMGKHPRKPGERLINRKRFLDWLVSGLIIGAGTVAIFMMNANDPVKARTMAFTVLVLFQLTNVFNCRHETKSLFHLKLFSNKLLLFAVAVSLILQISVVEIEALRVIFKTTSLSLWEWSQVVGMSLSIVFYEEIKKAIFRARKKE